MEDEIVFRIDVMLARRKMSVTELAESVGITLANMSILKNGKAKALKLTTLARLCAVLDCQPGDLLEYRKSLPPDRAKETLNKAPAEKTGAKRRAGGDGA